MATKVFDAVATTGTYTDRQGNEKKRYVTVGAVFEDDQKRMSLKIESLPVGGTWNGWISFFTPKEKTDAPAAKPAPKQTGRSAEDVFDDGGEIPF
jgi:hypothetical protein